MKTNLKLFLVSSLFLISFVFPFYALNHELSPVTDNGSRSWRLNEQTIQYNVNGIWANGEFVDNYYFLASDTRPYCTVHSYFDSLMGWIPGNVENFTYDSTGQYITEIISSIIIFDEHIPIMRGISSYDAYNHLREVKVQVLGMDRQWTDIQRTHLIYQSGDRSLFRIVSWELGEVDFEPIYTKSDFVYDTNGRISIQTQYTSSDSINWFPEYQTSFSYHQNDTTTHSSLIELISKKLPLSLFYGQPMEIGMLTERIRQIWMFQFWQNDSRDSYSYTTGGTINDRAMTYHLNYYWDMVGEWHNNTLLSFTYDTNSNVATELMQNWDDGEIDWMNSFITTNTWETVTENEDETSPVISDLSLSAYPNPFNENFVFEVGSKTKEPVKIELFNLKGQKIHSEIVIPNSKVKLNNAILSNKLMSSGVYFLKAEQGNKKNCIKLIKLNK